MYCPDCGHQNPAGNRFCGMCGEHLPERSANAGVTKSRTEMRTEDIRAAADERRERIAEHDPEPVRQDLRHREPVDSVVRESERVRENRRVVAAPVTESELPPAVAEFYSSRTDSATPLETPATVGGPSFLGLSGSGASGGYSYLYEDEQPKSHAGAIVFLIVLAILAGVIYWQWVPIRQYVVNAAMTHSKTDNAAPAESTPSQPGSATASSDNATPQPGQPANPNGLPQTDNATAPDQPKANTAEPAPKDAAPKDATPNQKDTTPDKTSVPKDERPRSEVGRSSKFQNVKGDEPADEESADNEKTAERRAAPAQPEGAELVNSGEKYLYGRGVARNCNQALVDFNAAARQDNPRAMAHLGSLYATGQCVSLDRTQAYHWFSRALSADRGNTYIEHNLNMLWRDMTPDERTKATRSR